MIDQKQPLFNEGESVLKKLRELLGGISQEEFARRLGVAHNTVSRWERGLHPATLTIGQAKRLNDLLKEAGVTWEEIPDTLGPLDPA